MGIQFRRITYKQHSKFYVDHLHTNKLIHEFRPALFFSVTCLNILRL